MGKLKKIGRKIGGFAKKAGGAVFDVGKSAVKGAVKGVMAKLPGAIMVSGLIDGVEKQFVGGGASQKETEKKAGVIQNPTTVAVKASTQQSSEPKNIFIRAWDWLQSQKTKKNGIWIFWGIILLFVAIVVAVVYFLVLRPMGFFRKKRSSGGRSYTYARRSKASTVSAPMRTASKGRKKLSPAQQAALAKGRATLRRKRKK